jgi:truncated hemoglobin YjbI
VSQSLFDKVGGEPVIRAVVTDFYDHVFPDVMIGYMFRNADKARLIDKEIELAARMLGGPDRYTGKTMRQAHAKHRIFGGQFMRRLQLLKEAMARHDLPADVVECWVSHTEALRAQVTDYNGSDCG